MWPALAFNGTVVMLVCGLVPAWLLKYKLKWLSKGERFGAELIHLASWLFILIACSRYSKIQEETIGRWLGLSLNLTTYVSIMIWLAICCILYAGSMFHLMMVPEDGPNLSDFDGYSLYWRPIYYELLFRSILFGSFISQGSDAIIALAYVAFLQAGFFWQFTTKPNELISEIIVFIYNVTYSFFATMLYYLTGCIYACVIL